MTGHEFLGAGFYFYLVFWVLIYISKSVLERSTYLWKMKSFWLLSYFVVHEQVNMKTIFWQNSYKLQTKKLQISKNFNCKEKDALWKIKLLQRQKLQRLQGFSRYIFLLWLFLTTTISAFNTKESHLQHSRALNEWEKLLSM